MTEECAIEKRRDAILFFDSRNGDRLQEVIRELRYVAIDGMHCEPCALPENVIVRMSIVSAEQADCREAWRTSPTDAPSLLITENPSFENCLAASRDGYHAIADSDLSSESLAGWLRHFAIQKEEKRSHVLIVDDDELTSQVVELALHQADIDVSRAAGAREAFRILESKQIDAVLLDLQMPEVDGIELARIIRQRQKNLSLPIMFLSAERNPERQLEARQLGGDDFIVKPITPTRLGQIVKLRLDRAKALANLIERDSLTGLLNHARFNDTMQREVERSRRTGAKLSLAMIDIDNFKSVNDLYGHQTGDRVIRSLSNLFTTELRRTDPVGRWGGEEFTVLFLDTDAASAASVIDRLRILLESTSFQSENGPFRVSFSAGICEIVIGADVNDAVSAADAALYHAKMLGRGRTICADRFSAGVNIKLASA